MYSHPFAIRKHSPSRVPALLRDDRKSRALFGAKPARQKLLVPIDGSRISMRAVEHVITTSHWSTGTVHLLNVQQPIMAGHVTLFTSARMVEDLRRTAGEESLRCAKILLDANHVRYTAEVVFGSPAQEIIRCAVERSCTKIVMGTRGMGLVGNLLARSVAARVVNLARVPVTLIKAPAALALGTEHTRSTAA
jgi:nucleotide-binding universal stress UspA family protein